MNIFFPVGDLLQHREVQISPVYCKRLIDVVWPQVVLHILVGFEVYPAKAIKRKKSVGVICLVAVVPA